MTSTRIGRRPNPCAQCGISTRPRWICQQCRLVMCLACAGKHEHAAAGPRIVPWVEVTKSTSARELLAGLRTWSKITDTAIVSISPGGESLYPALRKHVPGMTIIPGIKTNDLLPRFDSVEGWGAVAQLVKAVCASTGQRRVLLENESAISWYLRGHRELDHRQFREAVEQLPAGIEVIWYPGVVGETEETQQRASGICQNMADLCDVRFTELTIGDVALLKYGWNRRARYRMVSIAKKPTIPILYCYGPSSKWWKDEEIPEALTRAADDQDFVILYPGAKRWPEAARSITRVLRGRHTAEVQPNER